METAKKRNLKKTINYTLVVGFFSFIVIYAIINTRFISRGIALTVRGLDNGAVYSTSTLDITGNAKRAKHVLVNGREINLDQEGEFSDVLVLLPGYNIITISAEDKFGTITKKTFDIVRKEEIINLESSS